MISIDKYIIISSHCEIVKGANRGIIYDTQRKICFCIPPQYCELLVKSDRKQMTRIVTWINDADLSYFNQFIHFLIQHELIFFTDNPNLFPRKSNQYPEPSLLNSIIIEINPISYNIGIITSTVQEAVECGCKSLQIRVVEPFTIEFIREIVSVIDTLDISHVEFLIPYVSSISKDYYLQIVERHSSVIRIIIFNANHNIKYEHRDQSRLLIFGEIIYTTDQMSSSICSTPSYESLEMIKLQNSNCLFKKISIDSNGEIKHCPYSHISYGNILNTNIKNVLKNKDFTSISQKYIRRHSKCRVCEYRTKCIQCGLKITSDINSHLPKCKYSPYTNIWDD